MIINILGTGAIGGFYGAILNQKANLNFLARSNYQQLKSDGLEIKSIFGNSKIENLNLFDDIGSMPEADFSILCCKTSANTFFYDKVAKTLKPEGGLVIIQNGIGEEAKFREHLDQEIIGCSAFISVFLTKPNQVTHTGFGNLAGAVYQGLDQTSQVSDNLKNFASLFNDSGVDFLISENLPELRWKKLVWNVMFNGLCVIYNSTTDVVCNTPESFMRGVALMKEIQLVAKAYGVEIADDFIEKMSLSHKNMDYKPSMYLDYLEGRPLELNSIYLSPVKLAEAKAINLPEMKKIYQELSELTI